LPVSLAHLVASPDDRRQPHHDDLVDPIDNHDLRSQFETAHGPGGRSFCERSHERRDRRGKKEEIGVENAEKPVGGTGRQYEARVAVLCQEPARHEVTIYESRLGSPTYADFRTEGHCKGVGAPLRDRRRGRLDSRFSSTRPTSLDIESGRVSPVLIPLPGSVVHLSCTKGGTPRLRPKERDFVGVNSPSPGVDLFPKTSARGGFGVQPAPTSFVGARLHLHPLK